MKNYLWWLAKVITLFLFLIVIPVFLITAFVIAAKFMASFQDEVDQNNKNVVAVIELNDEIMKSKEVVDELYKQVKNPKVKGIVLRIDSPGGAVAPSQDIYGTVKKLKEKKPIVVSMGSVAASGGLYSALGASKILCQPGTLTGSIGVIMQIPNVAKIADQVGFKMVTLRSGQFKDAGNMFREMTPEDRNLLNGTIMDVREQFVQAVVDGRGLRRADVEKFADGRVILGSEAKKLGLVDDFGDVYDAGRVVFELLNEPLPEGVYPTLFYPEDNMKKFKKILQGFFAIPLQVFFKETNSSEIKMLYR